MDERLIAEATITNLLSDVVLLQYKVNALIVRLDRLERRLATEYQPETTEDREIAEFHTKNAEADKYLASLTEQAAIVTAKTKEKKK